MGARPEWKAWEENSSWKDPNGCPPAHTHCIRVLFEEGLEVERIKRNTENQRDSKIGPMKQQRKVQRLYIGS